MLKDVLETRFTAKFWENKSVETDKLQYVLDCAYLAPSKQGKFNHKIYVLTESSEGQAFKDWLYFNDTWCLDGVRAKPGAGLRRYNGQVRAPVVLLWVATKYPAGPGALNENETQRVRDDCIVSATMAMCAAEEIGLATGFNACLGGPEVAAHMNLSNNMGIIAMGLGYAQHEPRQLRDIYRNAVAPCTYPNSDPKSYPNAYELLRRNEQFIVEEALAALAWEKTNNTHFSKYTYSEEKCRRDLSYVFAALLHDVQHNTNLALRTVVSEYWSNGRPQVRRIAEPFVYNFIRLLLANNVLRNTAVTNLKQQRVAQVIDLTLVAEESGISFINDLIRLIDQGIRIGANKLEVIGNDLANIDPSIKTSPNRKNKPSKEVMINYI